MIKKTEKEIMKTWKTQMEPLVSILSLTYNHEKFVAMALDSMLMQKTVFPFEVIIRDDYSTDRTAAIIKDYTQAFPNIVKPIFETENQFSKGVSGFPPVKERARGKYVAILEGDDYWRDELKLQKQVDFLEKNGEYVLSYHNSIIVNEKNEEVSIAKNTSPSDYSEDDMLCGEVSILTNTAMFRNIKLTLPPQKIFNTDTVIWHLLGYHGKAKYQEDIIYAAYRMHSGGIWSTLDKVKKFENAVWTMHILKNLLPDNYNRLKKRIVKNTNRRAFLYLYRSIKLLDFKAFRRILRLIVKSEDLSIFKVLLSMHRVFLQKIEYKYLKSSSEKIL